MAVTIEKIIGSSDGSPDTGLTAKNKINNNFQNVIDAIAAIVQGGGSSIAFSAITDKPTTLFGYGITDAYTKTESNTLYGITKAKIEDVLTGDITSHNHDTLYYRKAEFDTKFLRKDIADTAAELITFTKGLTSKEDSVFEKDVKSLTATITDTATAKKLVATETLTTLNAVIAGLAEAYNLTVENTADIMHGIIREYLSSETFVSGFLGSGFKIWQENGLWNGEFDKLTVRKTFTVFELVVQKIVHQGGMVIRSAAGGVLTNVTDGGTYWKCEHDSTDDFVDGDQVLCQTFTGTSIKRYWRLVTSAGAGYFNLSKADCEVGSANPVAGDNVSVLGNRTVTSRQSAQIDCSVGDDAPYRDDYRGINSYSLVGKLYNRSGNCAGIVDADFGTLTEDITLYGRGVALKGTFMLLSGKTVETAISDSQLEFEAYADAIKADLQSQIDGVVDNWYYAYTPTTNNIPASTWNTDVLKAQHVGDTFTNTQAYVDDTTTPDAGKSWRWVLNAGVYSWTQIADSDAVKALLAASKAQDTADGKRRVFTVTPFVPYSVGDLWAQGTTGDLMRCITARSTGSYTAGDWDKASKYTDDSSLNTFVSTTYTTQIQALETSISLKATATTVNALDTRLSAAELLITPEAINFTVKTQTETITQEAVNALEIGGRNLVLGSKVEETSNLYRFAGRSVYLIAGQAYTFSFNGHIDQQALSDSKDLRVFFYIPDWSWQFNMAANTLVDSTHFSTFTAPITGYYSISSYLFPSEGSRLGLATVNWYKVEKGSKATDWTPAPEDMVDKTTYEANLTVLNNSISSKVSQTDFNTLSTTVTTHSTAITQLPNTIDARITTQVASGGSIYTAVASSFTMFEDKITLFGKEVVIDADLIVKKGLYANTIDAGSATISNLTVTNATVTGTINANAGTIGGWTINSNALTISSAAGAKLKVEITGDRFLRINDDVNTLLVIRNDGADKTCLSLSTYGNSTGLFIIANGPVGGGFAVESYGDHRFTARPGETIRLLGDVLIEGLQLNNVQFISAGSIDVNQSVAILVGSSEYTVDLPSLSIYSNRSKIIFIKNAGSARKYIRPLIGNSIIADRGDSFTYSNPYPLSSNGDACILVGAAGYWYQFKTPRDW